jgi:elongation factor G
MAHIDAGKTTTTERVLFYTGVNRTRSARCTTAPRPWTGWSRSRSAASPSPPPPPPASGRAWPKQKQEHRINIIDTPATSTSPSRSSAPARAGRRLRAVLRRRRREPQSETVWRQANKYGVPRLAFVNKMDRAGANFFCAWSSRSRAAWRQPGADPVLPDRRRGKFEGVVDLVKMKAIIWDEADPGHEVSPYGDIPGRSCSRDLQEVARKNGRGRAEATTS